MRRNPPLAEHMASDSLQEISKDLAQRLYDDPSEGVEFVRDCLRAVASGLGDRSASGEYANKREIAKHLHEAWKHLSDALAVMHPRSNPYDFASAEEHLPDVDLSASTEVQSLALSKKRFSTAVEAKRWARQHGFEAPKVDETENEWRLRQDDPSFFHPESFRSIKLRPGVRAIIGKRLADD